MRLRPRQKTFVDLCESALRQHGNTLGVAPTGAGKTVMFSDLVGRLLRAGGRKTKAAILAHRDELTAQNIMKFLKVNPGTDVSIFDASRKSWNGQATFAMVPTLHRNLETMPRLDVLAIDEAHHIPAQTYEKCITRAYELNPDLLLFGTTATANRGDKKRLNKYFTNIADQISLGELVRTGDLVLPRTFVIDVGVQEDLKRVKKTVYDYDMDAVASIMNKRVINEKVVEKWLHGEQNRERPLPACSDRRTVVFCSTVDHAVDVYRSFADHGVAADMVWGGMAKEDRRRALKKYANGETQVMVNVAVLTEGWDDPPTSCVILLRPSSFKSTLIQMIGRGLRKLEEEHLQKGMTKSDCIVLDFGISTIIHGSLEDDAKMAIRERKPGEAPTKTCPECQTSIPLMVMECPICGYDFGELDSPGGGEIDGGELSEFVMTEIDILRKSNFQWADLFKDDMSYFASGFEAWAGIFNAYGTWYAVGGLQNRKGQPKLLMAGERILCFSSGDDWMNNWETDDTARKTKRWLHDAPTQKQLDMLNRLGMGGVYAQRGFQMTRYEATSLISFRLNRNGIHSLIMGHHERKAA